MVDFSASPKENNKVIASSMISEETVNVLATGAATSEPPRPTPKKRQLIGLSGKQKRAICLYKEQNPRLIHTEISDHFTRKWKFKVPLSTVSYILKTKNRWLNQSTAKNYIRLKKHQYQKLHNDLYEWFKEKRVRGEQVTDNMLVEQGKRLGDKLGIVDFPYSPRWLRGFKATHGLSNNPVNAQYCTVVEKDKTTETQKRSDEPQDQVSGFAYNDIYSFLEMCLAYTERPDKNSASGENVATDATEIIQVFLCTNSTGSDKLDPMVMGSRAELPDIQVAECATYKAIEDTAQADLIIEEWLQNVNRQMSLNKRQILLLFHTERCHRYSGKFTNVEIMFVPPSDAFHTHLNIAEIFRSHYGNFLLDRLCPYKKKKARSLQITLRDALQLVKASWNRVSEETIRECWCNAGLETFQKCWKRNHESSNCVNGDEKTVNSSTVIDPSLPSTRVKKVRTAFAAALQYFQQDVSHRSAPHVERLQEAQRAMETVISTSLPSKCDFKSLFDSKKD